MIQARARYFGKAPAAYAELNRQGIGDTGAAPAEPAPGSAQAFVRAATVGDLASTVRVVRLPGPARDELRSKSPAALAELAELRAAGYLAALRGGRETDLARPLAAAARGFAHERCPNLRGLVEAVESVLAGGPLFVRTLKLDRARASSTDPSAELARTNLHFDAGKSCLAEYREPIFQFYLNAGLEPRQFRILPVPRPELLARVAEATGRAIPDLDHDPLDRVLAEYLQRVDPVEQVEHAEASDNGEHSKPEARLEWIPVPSGYLAVFDGRTFAHDAGKGALLGGRFEPSQEPDFVLALDTVTTGYHAGHYRPELPFFEDTGFSA